MRTRRWAQSSLDDLVERGVTTSDPDTVRAIIVELSFRPNLLRPAETVEALLDRFAQLVAGTTQANARRAAERAHRTTLLTRCGYSVSADPGNDRKARRVVLGSIVRDDLPLSLRAEVLRRWGPPGRQRADRLRRIIHRRVVNAAKSANAPHLKDAIRRWQDDMEWLDYGSPEQLD